MNDPQDDLYRERDAQGEWSEEEAPIRTRPSGSELISLRVPAVLLTDIEAVMSHTRESLSEFVRAAVTLRLYGQPVPTVDIFSTLGKVVLFSPVPGRGWTENLTFPEEERAFHVPDLPPSQVAT